VKHDTDASDDPEAPPAGQTLGRSGCRRCALDVVGHRYRVFLRL